MIGVYLIKNTLTDTAYVGSSVNIKTRWTVHKSSLRGGYHANVHLQRAWNKYGEQAFQFVVLELCSVETLREIEQKWLDFHRKESKVYNMAINTSDPMTGRVSSEETRQKISRALTGLKRTERECRIIGERSARDYPAFVHVSGDTIPAGRNLSKLCRNKGFSLLAMKQVVRGVNKSHDGWMLKSRAIHQPDGTWTIDKGSRADFYPAFIHSTGEIIPAGKNLAQLCHKRGLSRPHMYSVKNGQRPTCQGWMLKSKAKQAPDETWFVELSTVAKPYPAFVHESGEIIPAGINLRQMCQERGLNAKLMYRIKNKQRAVSKGWRLLDE